MHADPAEIFQNIWDVVGAGGDCCISRALVMLHEAASPSKQADRKRMES